MSRNITETYIRRVCAMQTLNEIVDKTKQKLHLLGQMRRSLIHTFIKEDEMEFTNEKFFALLRAYHKAVEGKHEAFVFEGHDILTSYARYLLEYLQEALLFDAKDVMLMNALKRSHNRKMEDK